VFRRSAANAVLVHRRGADGADARARCVGSETRRGGGGGGGGAENEEDIYVSAGCLRCHMHPMLQLQRALHARCLDARKRGGRGNAMARGSDVHDSMSPQ
jgi:hypothetical protein